MAVPNTTTFSLRDVTDEVVPSVNSLVVCFNESDANYFNITYKDQYYADYGNRQKSINV
jgi:hypothetical protein